MSSETLRIFLEPLRLALEINLRNQVRKVIAKIDSDTIVGRHLVVEVIDQDRAALVLQAQIVDRISFRVIAFYRKTKYFHPRICRLGHRVGNKVERAPFFVFRIYAIATRVEQFLELGPHRTNVPYLQLRQRVQDKSQKPASNRIYIGFPRRPEQQIIDIAHNPQVG